jgi:hypothetical protein
MASIPTQEEVLAATRKSQEAMIAAFRAWLETVRAATPRLTSVYAPLTERLPKLPPVTLPFADKLPTPEEAVGNAYHMAEQLLASQRKFAEDLVKAVTPLMPGHSQGSPEVPSRSAWQDAVAASEPKPVAVKEPEPVVGATSAAAEAAPTRPAAKSTGTKSTGAKSAADKSGAAKSAPKRTTASRTPKGTDAS